MGIRIESLAGIFRAPVDGVNDAEAAGSVRSERALCACNNC